MTAPMCVIFNPASGKGRARERLQRLRQRWRQAADLIPTEQSGHAAQLASSAAKAGYEIVAAAGGDGTAHEVVNGILRAGRPEVRFALLPLGSANDYAYSLGLLTSHTDGIRNVDVGVVRADRGRERYFACNLGTGLNSEVTRESRRLPWLQGLALYGVATLRALVLRFRHIPLEIRIDDEPPLLEDALLLSVLNGKREGGFALAPQAQLDDGRLDFLIAGAVSRLRVLTLMPRLAIAGPPADQPHVSQGRCQRLRLRCSEPLLVHTDGEFFCEPRDDVHELTIEVLPGALRVDLGAFREAMPRASR